MAEFGKEAEAAEIPTDFSHALLSVTVCACAVYTHTVYVVFVHYARGCVKIEAALLALLMCMHRCKKKPLSVTHRSTTCGGLSRPDSGFPGREGGGGKDRRETQIQSKP